MIEKRTVTVTVISCDEPGCEEEVRAETFARAVSGLMDRGWRYESAKGGGIYCLTHHPFLKCVECGRNLRPSGRLKSQFEGVETFSRGRGGMCNSCTVSTDRGELGDITRRINDAATQYAAHSDVYLAFIESTLPEEMERLAAQLLDRHEAADIKEVLALA